MTAKKTSGKRNSKKGKPNGDGAEETALTVFQKHEVPDALANRLLELFPGFTDMDEAEQLELIEFVVDQAAVTTQQVRSRFPTIKVKHAGVNKIEIPAPVGEEEKPLVTDIEAVMVYQYLTKAWWKKEVSEGGGGAPDCASLDALVPYTKEKQAEKCLTCPMNKFGTAKGGNARGKACRDIKRLILLITGHELPLRISVSSANIKSLDQYLNDVRDIGLPIGTMLTRIKAVPAKNANDVDYTGLEFSTIRQLTSQEILGVMAAKKAYESDFRIGSIEQDETSDSGDAPDPNARTEQTNKAKAKDVM